MEIIHMFFDQLKILTIASLKMWKHPTISRLPQCPLPFKFPRGKRGYCGRVTFPCMYIIHEIHRSTSIYLSLISAKFISSEGGDSGGGVPQRYPFNIILTSGSPDCFWQLQSTLSQFNFSFSVFVFARNKCFIVCSVLLVKFPWGSSSSNFKISVCIMAIWAIWLICMPSQLYKR